jgi:WD40 repeat protein
MRAQSKDKERSTHEYKSGKRSDKRHVLSTKRYCLSSSTTTPLDPPQNFVHILAQLHKRQEDKETVNGGFFRVLTSKLVEIETALEDLQQLLSTEEEANFSVVPGTLQEDPLSSTGNIQPGTKSVERESERGSKELHNVDSYNVVAKGLEVWDEASPGSTSKGESSCEKPEVVAAAKHYFSDILEELTEFNVKLKTRSSHLVQLLSFVERQGIGMTLTQALGEGYFLALPDELFLHILSFLSGEELCLAASVSRKWKHMCDDPILWRSLYKAHWRNEFVRQETSAFQKLQQQTDRKNKDRSCPSADLAAGSGTHPHPSLLLVPVAASGQSGHAPPGLASINGAGMVTLPVNGSGVSMAQTASGPGPLNSTIIGSVNGAAMGRFVVPAVPGTTATAWTATAGTTTTGQDSLCRTMNWKGYYLRRLKVESYWRKGRVRSVGTLVGHTAWISCLKFDDTRIVSGAGDKTIRIWDLAQEKLIMTLKAPRGVLCLQFDNDKIVSGYMDNTIVLWDIKEGKRINTIKGHTGRVWAVQYDSEKIISGAADRSIKVWDLMTLNCTIAVPSAHADGLSCLQFDDRHVVSGAADSVVKVWDVRSLNCVQTLHGEHEKAVFCVALDGDSVVSGSHDSTVKQWDLRMGKCLNTFTGHQQGVFGVQFDSKKIVSCAGDHTVKIWDAITGENMATLTKHKDAIRAIQYDETKIVSGSSTQDKTIKIWRFI